MSFYFFRFGRNFRESQLRHLISPWLTFKLEARIFDLQFLHTKIFFIFRAIASSNRAMV